MPPSMAPCLRVFAVALSAAVAAAAKREGRCPGSYMSIGWSGMSKAKCMARAYEVNQGPGPEGSCGHVSYSASPVPQQQSDFCRCHGACGGSLEQPSGQAWETYVVSQSAVKEAEGSGDSKSLVIVSVCAATGFLALVATAVFFYRRGKRAGAAAGKPSEAKQPEQLEAGQHSVADVALEYNNNNNNNNNNNAATLEGNDNAVAA